MNGTRCWHSKMPIYIEFICKLRVTKQELASVKLEVHKKHID